MAWILVAEDDPIIRSSIVTVLEKAGHHVDAVAHGKAALVGFVPGVHELAITDIFMPELDGIEVIIELRRRSRTLPIIAISETASPVGDDFLGTARLLGATRTFKKPLDRSELLAAVEELVGPGDPDVAG